MKVELRAIHVSYTERCTAYQVRDSGRKPSNRRNCSICPSLMVFMICGNSDHLPGHNVQWAFPTLIVNVALAVVLQQPSHR